MASLYQLQKAAEAAHIQASSIARGRPESEQVRVLAAATAETARILGELAKKVRYMED